MAKENKENPTSEQIEEWKAKYKTVHKLTIEDKTAYLRSLDRQTLSLAMSKIAKNDLVGGTEAILENCWLGGNEEIKTDTTLFTSAMGVVGDLMQVKTATLEKL